MKPVVPLLILSLVGNLALAALVVRRASASTITTSAISVADANTPVAAAVSPTASPNSPKLRQPLWAGLKSDSFDDAIARLRAAGFPPKEIAAAIRAMIVARANERRSASKFAPEKQAYWQINPNAESRERQQEMLNIVRDSQRLERTYMLTPELFGADEETLRTYRTRFGPFAPEKLRQIALLESNRLEKNIDSSANNGSAKPGEDRYKFDPQKAQAEAKQHEEAIKAILTTDEYAAYELRNGPGAMGLRSRLESFRPSEAEYRALFELQKSAYAGFTGAPPTAEQAAALRADYEAKVKATLGPERAADYAELSKNHGDKLPRLMARLNLPLATLGAITAVRDHTNAQAKAIQSNQQLTAAERSAQLAALAAEAKTQLTHTLGAEGFDAYNDLKGEWLRNLAPKPGGP